MAQGPSAVVHAAVYGDSTLEAHLMAGPQGAVQEAKLARVHCTAEPASTLHIGPSQTPSRCTKHHCWALNMVLQGTARTVAAAAQQLFISRLNQAVLHAASCGQPWLISIGT